MKEEQRLCTGCSGPITKKAKTGFCKACWSKKSNTDPVLIAKRRETRNRTLKADPTLRKRISEALKAACQRPEEIERRRNAPHLKELWRKGLAGITPEVLARRGQTISAARMAWCPVELRDEYKRLMRVYNYRAGEARAMILAQHERNMAEFRRSIGAE